MVPKSFTFSDILHVERSDIALNERTSDYKLKFLVRTTEKTIEFFARTEFERDKWLEYFWKAFDLQQNRKIDFNKPSQSYLDSNTKNRHVIKYQQNKMPESFVKDGFEHY